MEFTPEQKVINDLFGSDLTYTIPTYQRPYSWDSKGKSNKDIQVNIMWDDLLDHFEEDRGGIYFMGSMVMIGNSADRNFEVVDGQQRLTTITLLFVAVKCMLTQLTDDELEENRRRELISFKQNAVRNIESILFNEEIFGAITQNKKVKIESTFGGFSYDDLLERAIACGTIPDLLDANEEQIKASKRYFSNRDFFIEKLKEKFLTNSSLTYNNAEVLNHFIDFLKNKVTIVRILSPTLDVAFQVFEILNNRGLPLSNKDLFRNFMISELTSADIDTPEQKWLSLDDSGLTSEFISRYVESKTASKQKYSAFNDMKDIYNNFPDGGIGTPKILGFYEDIDKNLSNYVDIEDLRFESKAIKHRICFLKNAGNSKYIINVLIALLNNTREENQIIKFLSQFELFIIYLLLGPSKRFQTKTTFETIEYLNSNDYNAALEVITLSQTEKDDLKSILLSSDFKDNDIAKLLLSRYIWALDIESPEDVVGLDLKYRDATLEHIIPQKPDVNTNWVGDFTQQFRDNNTYKLGNMTLLTQKMNSKAKNYDFSRKKDIYLKMKLTTTSQLGQLNQINETFITNRNEQIIQKLISHLDL